MLSVALADALIVVAIIEGHYYLRMIAFWFLSEQNGYLCFMIRCCSLLISFVQQGSACREQ